MKIYTTKKCGNVNIEILCNIIRNECLGEDTILVLNEIYENNKVQIAWE